MEPLHRGPIKGFPGAHPVVTPAPDHKTIADFRKDNGLAIRKVCTRFVAVCRMMGLLTQASIAIDGSKFKAVNNRDKNFTHAKMDRRGAN